MIDWPGQPNPSGCPIERPDKLFCAEMVATALTALAERHWVKSEVPGFTKTQGCPTRHKPPCSTAPLDIDVTPRRRRPVHPR